MSARNSVDADTFKAVMASFPSGVTIVTTVDPYGSPHGMTVSAFMSLSLEPPLVGVSLARNAGCTGTIIERSRFCVNMLAMGRDALSNRFAARDIDRFADLEWSSGPFGMPVLDDEVIAYAECDVQDVVDAGDHVIVVGRVIAAYSHGERSPLVYHRSRYRALAGVDA